ncbi:MAG: hypothetical protein LBL42_04170 [Tannerella sp.]|jgi:hypothetical protein|nr:hypothetical protein [Tannerella sp.]
MDGLVNISIFLFILFIVSGGFSCQQAVEPELSRPEVPCEPEEGPQQELPWDYPVKPGTDGWIQLHSHDDMIDVCQIPEAVLSGLSTADLTDICLDYPYKLIGNANQQ